MGKFKETGRKRERLLIRKNYWQQAVSKRERFFCIGAAAGITVLTGWLFYKSIWSLFFIWPFGLWIYKSQVRERIEKKKSQFLFQFRSLTECMAQALNIGQSAENALKGAASEMRILYLNDERIIEELEYMVRQLRLQIPLEQILEEFSQRVELEDVKNFATVFAAAKRSGGDMIGIIQNTASQISDKIDVKREIDIILASKRYEFRVMCVIPYIMILYMRLSFPEFMGVLYGNAVGIGVMSICLVIYVSACLLGLKLIKIDV